MAEQIEQKVEAGGFFLTIIPSLNSLHGYTHGGLEQLARRFSLDENLKPNYTDGEKQEVINAATAHFTMLAVTWCRLIAGQVMSPHEILTKTYGDLYGG